jgi:hypothetical protein
MTPSTITSPEVRRRKLLDDAIQNPTQGGPRTDHVNAAMNQEASPALAQAKADAMAATNPLTAGIPQQAAPKPETEMVGGIPHLKLDNPKYPGPLGMLGGAVASTIGYAATAPFGDRAAGYREASRAGLDTSDEIKAAQAARTNAGQTAKPTAPTVSAAEAGNDTGMGGVRKITAAGANPLFTNIDPEKAAGGLRDQAMSSDAEGLARHARANAIRQQMVDAQPRGGSSVLGGLDAQGRTRQEVENDEKSARWRQDELANQAKYRPQMAGIAGAAIQGDTQQGVEETRQQGIMAGVGAQRRGQNMQAQTEAAKLAGNPADNALKTAQAKIAGIGADKAQAESSMLAEAQDPNTPPERRKALITSILAAQGKSPNENRYMATTEKLYDPVGGNVTGERARIFDKETGRFAGENAEKPKLGDADIQRIAKETGMATEDIRARAAQHASGWKIKTLDDVSSVDVALSVASGTDPEMIRKAIVKMGGNPADYGLK